LTRGGPRDRVQRVCLPAPRGRDLRSRRAPAAQPSVV